jgi:nucleoside-diphosphate-sugar epimerase
MSTVLITGGSGFIGAHCIVAALAAGYSVRTTLRTPSRESEVRAMVGADANDALEFVVTSDDGWGAAVAGCEAVLHVASPFALAVPEHEDELIVPARDGTLRVLEAARDAGVRRVVLTSSFAAIGYGDAAPGHVLTEADWTDPDGDISPYLKSKTIAERAAWDFVAHESGGLELATVNPVGVFGPPLGRDVSVSLGLITALLGGAMRGGAPNLSLGVVDVRDVADLHLRAMTDPAAAGERFLAASGDAVTLPQIAAILRERLGDRAAAVPATTLSTAQVRAAAGSDPLLAAVLPELDHVRHFSAEKARRVLGWSPRPVAETIVATAESLLQLELIS